MCKAINSFRSVKEEWELERMRKAQQIADKAFAEVLPRIKAGMTELELQAELIYCMYKNGGQGLSFDPIVVSGPNTSLPHGVATDRVIREGDFITMDFGVLLSGYCSDMTRTVAVGEVSSEQRNVYETVLCAKRAAMEGIKPQIKCQTIDKIARDLIDKAGYQGCFGHGLGHSIGLDIHENPCFNTRCETLLQSGMVLTVEPGIYLENKFGVRIEDMVVVTEQGYENLTQSPDELIIV
jgi:Xaa-Pro aminopeptidase